MKTLKDVQIKLKAELKQWFVKQTHNPFEDYYLYYRETTPKHDGGILICVDPPNKNYKMSGAGRINKNTTIEANFTLLHDTIMRLPILSIRNKK